MSSLPEDLYLDILLRLPVKSLLTCKCVSKSWYELISDTSFVKSHLDLALQENNPSFMLEGVEKSTNNGVIHSIKYEVNEFDDINAIEMDYPFKSSGSRVELVGSCNGLVCIWSNDFFYLWNPATNEHKKLPESPSKYPKNDMGTCAFGYDCKSDDYMLVYVVDFVGGDDSSIVEIYTLGSNSWKSIQTISNWVCAGSGVLINGALHCSGIRRDVYSSCLLVVFFDINNNKFNELQLPKEPLKNCFSDVRVVERCLCILLEVGSCVEVWVMKDYGVPESWTKIYTRLTNSYRMSFIGSLKNGKILLLGSDNLVICDLKPESVRELNVCNSVNFISGDKYFETLVSLNSGTYSGIEAHIEESTKSRKRKRL